MSFWNKLIVKITGDSADLDNTLNKSEGKLQGFASKIGKWFAAGAAAVAAALGIIAMAMKSTEGSADKLEASVALLKGGWQGFMQTVMTGDWQNLIDNITKTAKATRDLAVARDQLKDISASNQLQKAGLSQQLAAARLAAAGTSDKGQKAEFLQQAIDLQKQITALELSEVNIRIKNWEDFFKTKLQYDEETNAKIVANFRKIASQENSMWGEMGIQQNLVRAKQQLTDRGVLVGLTAIEKQTLSNVTAQLIYIEEYEKMRNVMGSDEFNKYIADLKEYGETAAEGDVALRRVTRSLTTLDEQLEKTGTSYGKFVQKISGLKPPADLTRPEEQEFAIRGADMSGQLAAGPMNQAMINFQAKAQDWNNIIEETRRTLINSAGNMVEDLFTAMSSGNWDDFGTVMLESIASFLSMLGNLLISFALAESGFMQALKNPALWPVALAAGIAAKAAAGLIRGAISNGSSSMASGGGGYSSGGSAELSNMRVEVVGKLEGKDIVIASKRYMNEN